MRRKIVASFVAITAIALLAGYAPVPEQDLEWNNGFFLVTSGIQLIDPEEELPLELVPEESPVLLHTSHSEYILAETEEISYNLINNTGEPILVVLAPILEILTESGWQFVPMDGIGFCGTPDSVGSICAGTLPLSWYQEDALIPGRYRLSFSLAWSDLGADMPYVWCEFDLL